MRVRHDLSRAYLLFFADCAAAAFRPAQFGNFPRRTPADPRRLAAAVRRPSRRARGAGLGGHAAGRGNAAWLGDAGLLRCFTRQAGAIKSALVDLLGKLKEQGKSIAAYGAAAKGSTLLNFCGLGRETFDFVADRSTFKQWRFTPGLHLPIVPPEHLLENMPDYTLLLTWNFADEILAQQRAYRERGGKFILPIPEVKMI